jgi:hypothetical protein
MARGPDKPREIFEAYAEDVRRVFGDELEGIVVYGDVVTGDYDPARSQIEFLVSVSDASFARIKGFAPFVAGWRKRRVATPHIVSHEYIQSSLDSSPIELLNMHLFHELVDGRDVLADLAFDKEHLRVVCEREVKRRLERIKRSYLDREGELKQIMMLMGESIDHVVGILRAMIHLHGKEAPGPRKKVFKSAGKIMNLSEAVFLKVVKLRDEGVKESKSECANLFDDYVRQIEHVVEIVDRM